MMEFKISKGWAIFVYIAALLLIVLFCFLLFMPWIPGMKNDMPADTYWFMAPISILMILLGIMGILEINKAKFVIDQFSVYEIHPFYRRELLLSEIKGFRTNDKYIFIEPHEKNKKKISISTYYGNTHQILNWLSERYPDLDITEAETEKENILNNENYGTSLIEREENLSKARKVAKVINFTSGTLAAWLLLYPFPYKLAIIVNILVPLICIFIVRRFKGLIRVEEKKISAYPTIFWAFFISTMILCTRSLLDLIIFDHSGVWKPVIIITVLLMASLFFANHSYNFSKIRSFGTLFIYLIFLGCYSYGALTTLNCVYDNSYPEIYSSKILNKTTSSGKSTSYYLELSPWGPQKEVDDVKIPKVMYESSRVNDEVFIYYFKGRFGIPWFEIGPGEVKSQK